MKALVDKPRNAQGSECVKFKRLLFLNLLNALRCLSFAVGRLTNFEKVKKEALRPQERLQQSLLGGGT